MNEFITRVLDVATDPSHASTADQQLRERLMNAGLLVVPSVSGRVRPSRAAVEAAARRAKGGTTLADLVGKGR